MAEGTLGGMSGAMPDTETRHHLRRLNMNLLYALNALLTHHSVTAAARSIHVSQPAMSAKLRQLRDHFADELVIHGDRRQLTALGEALLFRVGRVIREVDDTFNLTLDFQPDSSTQTITISAPEVVELMFVSLVVPHIRSIAPGIQFRMVPFIHGSAARLFDAGVDVAIVPDAMANGDLAARPLFTHRLTGLVWEEHPLAQREVSAEEYLAARHAAALVDMEKAMFGEYGPDHPLARRRVVARTGLHSMLPVLAMGSDLIVTTSDWFAQYHAASQPLRLVTLPFLQMSSTLVAQWQPYRSREPMIRWLVEQLVYSAGRIGGGASKN